MKRNDFAPRTARNGKKAFTLAELLIVVAILAVVAAIGILQYANARKNLTVKANDSNAKLIFMATQNQMLQMKEYGLWDALLEAHRTEEDYFGDEIANKPSDYEYYRELYNGPAWEDVQEDMRVISYTSQDMVDFKPFLNVVLPLGTVDDYSRTNGKYIIEYNVRTATVYGVFYTESAGEPVYTSENFTSRFCVDGSENGRPTGEDTETAARNVRRDYPGCILGYFGGGMSSSANYASLDIPEVKIENGEELVLYIKDTNSHTGTPVNGADPLTLSSLTITVRGKTQAEGSLNPAPYISYDVEWFSDAYYLRKQSGTGGQDVAYLVREFYQAEDGISYEIVLDSITTSKTDKENYHFAHNFCSMRDGGVGTGSIFPGDDIEVTVTVKPTASSNRITLPVSRTVETNSLFADADFNASAEVSTAYISQMRHLENLSRAISGVSLATEVTADFRNSISFDKNGEDLLPILPKDYTDTDNDIQITEYGGDVRAAFDKGSYVPVDLDGVALTVKGNGNNVYDVAVSCVDRVKSGGVGLFGTTDSPIAIRDLGIVSAKTPGEVTTVYTGKGHAQAIGAFVGSAPSAELTRCWSTVLIRELRANRDACIGGLVGNVSKDLSIEQCYVSGNTSKDGLYSEEANESNISVCGANNAHVGGLVGNVAGAAYIAESYCNASIGLYGTGSARYDFGGLVGNAVEGAKIDKSYYTGWMVMPRSFEVAGTLNYGGFVGNAPRRSVRADDGSFWIKDFLWITDLEENTDVLEDPNPDRYARLADEVAVEETEARPYDGYWTDYPYPYPNVAELKPHWGDWCVKPPRVGLYILPDVGVEVVSGDQVPAGLHAEYVDNGLFFRAVPEQTELDLDTLISVTLKTGFTADPVQYWLRDHWIQAYVQPAPAPNPDPHTQGHHYYVSSGRTAVIKVCASGLDTCVLNAITDLSGVYNYQSLPFSLSQTTPYAAGVSVKYAVAFATTVGNLPTGASYSVQSDTMNLTGGSTGAYIQLPAAEGASSVSKNHHYGSMYYCAYAVAYCTGALPDGTYLVSDAGTEGFTATLSRVPVTFCHTNDVTEGNYSISGTNPCYAEYNGGLYAQGNGESTIENGVLTNAPGDHAALPSADLANTQYGNYNEAFSFVGWKYYYTDTSTNTETSRQIYNAVGEMVNGYPVNNDELNWKATEPVDLYPMWSKKSIHWEIDLNGGYYEG